MANYIKFLSNNPDAGGRARRRLSFLQKPLECTQYFGCVIARNHIGAEIILLVDDFFHDLPQRLALKCFEPDSMILTCLYL